MDQPLFLPTYRRLNGTVSTSFLDVRREWPPACQAPGTGRGWKVIKVTANEEQPLRVAVLGPVRAWLGEVELGLGAPQRRAVLALLAVRANQVIARDELIDGIWGEELPASSVNALHVHVARLRAALEPSRAHRAPGQLLLATNRGYQLRLAAGCLDAEVFVEGLVAARAARAAGDPAGAAQSLDAALRLWQGGALADIPGPLAQIVRTGLDEQRLAATEEHVDAMLALGRHPEAAQRLVELVRAHPLRERFAAQLMLALYRSERQAEALAAFADARRTLASELGIEPGPQLRQLHAQVLAADPGLDFAAGEAVTLSPAPAGSRRPGPAQLPADVAAFTGRSQELAELSRLAAHSPDMVISVVSGTAGAGKTALAIRWARRVAREYPDGQLYVNLRGYDPGQPVPPGDALAGFLRAPGLPAPAATYRSLLDGRRVLVLLDNASSVEQVRPLLPGSSTCLVVVTSRDSLAGLVARHGARRLDLDRLPLADAVGLLRTLIGDRVDAEPRAAAELAGQCARLPLALRVAAELAAASPGSRLSGLAGELAGEQRRLDLLGAGGDEHTAIDGVFFWSYRHLPAAAARAFRLVGGHPGPDFDAYAVAALASMTITEARDVLALLARAHLVHPAGTGRHGLHDLLRAYASRLAAATDGDAAQAAALTRLRDYYLAAASSAMDALVPAEKRYRPPVPPAGTLSPQLSGAAQARAWLDAERASVVAMAVHAATGDAPGYTTRLAGTLYRYLETGGHYADAVTLHGHALQAARLAGDRAAEATALTNLGIISWRQGRYQQATGHHRHAMAASAEIGDLAGKATALANLGVVFERQGHYDEAADCHAEALALTRQLGDRGGEARELANLGSVAARRGDYEQAVRWYQRALAIFRAAGDHNSEASALPDLGLAYQQQGQHEQAIGCYQRALELVRESGDRIGEAEALNGVGAIMLSTGRPGEAQANHTAALTLASRIGDAYEQARAHNGLGAALQATGDITLARHHWLRALDLYAELGIPEPAGIRDQVAALDYGRPHDPGNLAAR